MKKLCIIFGCCLFLANFSAETWSCSSIQSLEELFGQSIETAELSPNGSFLAGISDSKLGIRNMTTGKTDWYELPRACKKVTLLSWSPDSGMIAFTQDFLRFMREPDIQVFFLKTGAFKNLTEDYTAMALGSEDKALIDIFPYWYQDSKTIGFLRYQRGDTGNSLYLMKISVNGGDPQTVFSFQDKFRDYSIASPPVYLDDGKSLAFSAMASDIRDPSSGLWILNPESGDLIQAADLKGITTALKLDINNSVVIMPISKILKVSGGILFSVSTSSSNITMLPLFYDLNTSSLSRIEEAGKIADSYFTLKNSKSLISAKFDGETVRFMTAQIPDFKWTDPPEAYKAKSQNPAGYLGSRFTELSLANTGIGSFLNYYFIFSKK